MFNTGNVHLYWSYRRDLKPKCLSGVLVVMGSWRGKPGLKILVIQWMEYGSSPQQSGQRKLKALSQDAGKGTESEHITGGIDSPEANFMWSTDRLYSRAEKILKFLPNFLLCIAIWGMEPGAWEMGNLPQVWDDFLRLLSESRGWKYLPVKFSLTRLSKDWNRTIENSHVAFLGR